MNYELFQKISSFEVQTVKLIGTIHEVTYGGEVLLWKIKLNCPIEFLVKIYTHPKCRVCLPKQFLIAEKNLFGTYLCKSEEKFAKNVNLNYLNFVLIF